MTTMMDTTQPQMITSDENPRGTLDDDLYCMTTKMKIRMTIHMTTQMTTQLATRMTTQIIDGNSLLKVIFNLLVAGL
jgi:hypothetical protein